MFGHLAHRENPTSLPDSFRIKATVQARGAGTWGESVVVPIPYGYEMQTGLSQLLRCGDWRAFALLF